MFSVRTLFALGLVSVLAAASAAPAADPADSSLVQMRLKTIAQQLSDSAKSLAAGGFGSLAEALQASANGLDKRAATSATVPAETVKSLNDVAARMVKLAPMYNSTNQKAKAQLLTGIAKSVQEAAAFCKTVEAPGSTESTAAAGQSAKPAGVASLAVRLTLEAPPPPAAGTGQQRATPNRTGRYGQSGGMPYGPTGGMPYGPPGGAPYGPAGQNNVNKVLAVSLEPVHKKFDDIGALAGYVRNNADQLRHTAVTFFVASDVTFGDVTKVVQIFSGARLEGTMKFAGLGITIPRVQVAAGQPGQAQVSDLSPVASGQTESSGSTGSTNNGSGTWWQALGWPSPNGPGESAGASSGQSAEQPGTAELHNTAEMDSFIDGFTRRTSNTTFFLAIGADQFDAGKNVVLHEIGRLEPRAKFSLVVVDDRNNAQRLCSNVQAGPAGVELAKQKLADVKPFTGSPNLRGFTDVLTRSGRSGVSVLFAEGPALNTNDNFTIGALMSLTGMGRGCAVFVGSPPANLDAQIKKAVRLPVPYMQMGKAIAVDPKDFDKLGQQP